MSSGTARDRKLRSVRSTELVTNTGGSRSPGSVPGAAELLAELRRRGVRLWAEGDRLRYDAPAGALGEHLVSYMRARKRELLEFLRRAEEASSTLLPPIAARARGGDAPLSFAQRRLWFVEQMQPGNPAYAVPAALRLRGTLDADALERSLREIVRRHEALRTTFHLVGEEPVQRVSDALDFGWDVEDLRDLGPDRARTRAARLMDELRSRPFDLARGPLFRARLLRETDDDHLLLLDTHHIVSDGWSLGVLTKELGALYAAFCADGPSPLPELPLQYADFAAWQQGWMRGAPLERQLGFWKEQLGGELPLLSLPTDRPRQSVQTTRGASESLGLPRELCRLLEELSRREGVTLFMTLLAGFAALLGRHSGQSDVLIGSPVANRRHAQLEGLIGVFVNMLVLRIGLPGEESFRDLLGRVRDVAVSAFAHQDLPFERLVEELHPDRDTSRNPLFQVSFALQNAPAAALELPGLELEPVPASEESVRFDLEGSVRAAGDALRVRFAYNADLFDAETIRRMLRHYRVLLESAVADPALTIGRLPLLEPEERQRLLVEWNASDQPVAEGPPVHRLVAEHAGRRPEAAAVVDSRGTLSYGELNARANRLAHHLRRGGVGPDSVVAVCCERGAELVVALLGVLKSGAAYLPIDPAYPRERIAYLLADSGARLAICQESCRESLPGFDGRLLWLDRAAADWGQEPDTDPEPGPGEGPASLAYVIYTSGSTGRPKGVEIEHRNLLNLVRWHRSAYEITRRDRGTQLASIGFDACVWELWPYLASGASVAVASDEVRKSPEALRDWLAREGVTVGFVPTGLAEPLLDLEWPADLALRALLTGGDRLRRYAPEPLPFALVNHYGPTEATVVASAGLVPAEAEPGRAPSIGRPISNARIHILDANREPVPIGVTGELYVGGAGIARGYRNQPELTRERFVEDPFAGAAGSRLYRTGDLARYRPDGSIDFAGRNDHQVKFRGFRIELGEIEAVLREHPGVRDAVVLARDDGGEQRLVAYAVGPASAAALREHLRERLPEHMVPSAYVPLDALPLTAHGKVDRDALPAPEGERQLDEPFVAPSTASQEAVAAIWRELLGLERVGVNDNFFDLGGHSMLVIRLQARLQEELDVELPIVELFRNPTVASLARHLGGEHRAESPLEAARARQAGRRAGGGQEERIAIVGMSGRFPGAADVEAFWSNLREGVESITFFEVEELRAAGVPERLLESPHFVRAHGAVDGQELFDAAFFGYNPREAELIDPQQRLFLECAWEALERAGCDPQRHPGLIGVYAGSSLNTYLANIQSQPERLASAGGMQVMLSSDKDFLATRVSYKLNLRGPSLTIQTACSTSLVAVHEACRALLHGECDLALAGGVSVQVPWRWGHLYLEEGVTSADGHCRAFDEAARGTTRGDGVGVVVLKRLSEALADRDAIHAVIRGTGINNDGASKIGYTAPSVDGQARAIATALAAADVDPDSVGYVEAHGTGTALGDPIEVAALAEVFRSPARGSRSCALGAVKTNVGHLDAAAGVAGLIKTALSLEHAELPPTLHFERANPKIDFEATPFFVNDRLRPWSSSGDPRRAGVSSFGLGGTNAHAVLEEAPRQPDSGPSRPVQILPLSARSPEALESASAALARHLQEHPGQGLPDVAHTLQVGRSAFECRRVVVCRDRDEAVDALRGSRPDRVVASETAGASPPSVVFLFPGQGAQHVGMARSLYGQERVFRDAVDDCARRFAEELDCDLVGLLYGPAAGGEAEAAERSRRLAETSIAQAALFSVELALARLWTSWGVVPAACIGHSIGEYVAACVGGVMSVEDAVRVVARRGRLMDGTARGSMLAIPLSEAELADELGEGTWLAAVNAPDLCVVSGDAVRVAALAERLAARGIDTHALATSHPFHSPHMEPAVAPLVRELEGIRLRKPRIPFVSNLTGAWITDAEATDPGYWGAHLRQPVRYAEGVRTLLAEGPRLLLEVGPGRTLTGLADRQLERGTSHRTVASLPHPRDRKPDDLAVLEALAGMWASGVAVDWSGFSADESRNRVRLPTYPFQRQRFWIDIRRSGPAPAAEPAAAAPRKAPIEEWLYAPVWKRTVPAGPATPPHGGRWCLLDDGSALGDALADRLRGAAQRVVRVAAGQGFARDGEDSWLVDPGSSEDYASLLRELAARQSLPERIVHLWGAAPAEPGDGGAQARRFCFESLIALAQALAGQTSAELRLSVVTTGLQDVTGSETLVPERALALGPCRVIPMELPHVRCRSIDLEAPGAPGGERAAAERLLRELLDETGEAAVAHRAGRRWVQAYDRLPSSRALGAAAVLKNEGCYLITGGLGGIGLELAGYLATSVGARLVLTGRSAFPEQGAWDEWLAGHDRDDPTSRRILRLREMQAAGAEVVLEEADVADREAMAGVIGRARERFGRIDGVVHAAGTTRGPSLRSIQELRLPDCEAQLRPKVNGLQVLDELLAGDSLDFAILTSSLSAVAGGLFLAAYAGANAFMDAFALRSRHGGTPWLSVNWDAWDHRGTAARSTTAEASRPADLAMTPQEGVALFERLLGEAAEHPQVVVSTWDLAARLRQWSRPSVAAPSGRTTPEVSSRHPRPQLQSDYQPPRTPTEELLVELWEEHLGVEQVGVHDSFFDLGGHSLLATRIAAVMRSRFEKAVSVANVFEHPTVHQLAQWLEGIGEGEAVAAGGERGSKRKTALMKAASRRRRGDR